MEPNNYRQGARPVHVLEIMLAARTAAATGQTVPLTPTFER
jgi:hypothetical protein